LEINRALTALTRRQTCPTSIDSLALINEYASSSILVQRDTAPLVRQDFLSHAGLQAKTLLLGKSQLASLAAYVRSGGQSWPRPAGRTGGTSRDGRSSNDAVLLGRALQLCRIPTVDKIAVTARQLRDRTIRDSNELWFALGSVLPQGTPASAIEAIAEAFAVQLKCAEQ
jgi:hypothetical protein